MKLLLLLLLLLKIHTTDFEFFAFQITNQAYRKNVSRRVEHEIWLEKEVV